MEHLRDAPSRLAAGVGNEADYRPTAGLVGVATLAPGDGPILSLQTACRPRSTTVVLGIRQLWYAYPL